MEVEATGDGIDVEHLASEEEVRTDAALERVHIYRREGDAATGDELIAETPLATDGMNVVGERLDESTYALLAQLALSFLLLQSRFRQYV